MGRNLFSRTSPFTNIQPFPVLRTLAFRSSFVAALILSVAPYSTSSFSCASSSFIKSGSNYVAATSSGRSSLTRSIFSKLPFSMSTTSDETSTKVSAGIATEALSLNAAGEKLSRLRDLMNSLGVDAYVVPTDDPHLSEYVSNAFARREYISGFQGSAGTALVTSTGAWLWTDSRYYNEATLQLDADYWSLMKVGLPKTPTIPKFLADLAVEARKKGTDKPYRIGIDPFVHPASFAKELEEAIETAQEAFAFTNTTDLDGASSNGPLTVIDTLDEV
jgi:Xaa-Pro aminopeptidase